MTDSTPARRFDVNRIVFDLVLLAFFTIIVVASLDLRPGAQLVPLLIGVPALAAMVLQLVLDVVRGVRRPRATTAAEAVGESVDADDTSLDGAMEATRLADQTEELESIGHGTPFRRQAVFIAWAVSFVVLAMVLTEFVPPLPGVRTYYLPVAFVALIGIFRYIGLNWLRALLIAVPTTLGLYLLLVVLVQVRI